MGKHHKIDDLNPGWIIAGTDTPCKRCGRCCKAHPCLLAPSDPCDPCTELKQEPDGTYSCGLVSRDSPGAKDHLLVGLGCGATRIPRRFPAESIPE